MNTTLTFQCPAIQMHNQVPIDVTVTTAPEITKPVRVKEEGKAVIETEETVRPAGFELRYTKSSASIGAYMTKEQLVTLRDHLNTLID